MKKKLSVCVVFVMVFLFTGYAFAEENNTLFISGHKVEKIYIVEGGVAREISIDEYNSISKESTVQLQNSKLMSDCYSANYGVAKTTGMTDDWYRYDEIGSTSKLMISERERVSIIAYNDTQYPVQRTFKSEINAMTIDPKEYGWFEFAPIKNKSWGYLKTFSWLGELKNQEDVTAYSPRIVNGFLDGVLYYMTDTLYPE